MGTQYYNNDNKIVYAGFAKTNDNMYAYYSNHLSIINIINELLKIIDLNNDIKKAYALNPQTFNLCLQYQVSNGIVCIVASEMNCSRKKCFELMNNIFNYIEKNVNLNPLIYENYLRDEIYAMNGERLDEIVTDKKTIFLGPTVPLISSSTSIANNNSDSGSRYCNTKYILSGLIAISVLIVMVAVSAIIILTR